MQVPSLLKNEISDSINFFKNHNWNEDNDYELFYSRMGCIKNITKLVDKEFKEEPKKLYDLQTWFRNETDPLFNLSATTNRARTWPEGYPGDYITLEGIYANKVDGVGLARHVENYCLTSTLAVAIRSRLQKLIHLVQKFTETEAENTNWLNLACGPCRELLSIKPNHSKRVINCVDTDANALKYAENLLVKTNIGQLNFVKENAFRFLNAALNIKKYGYFNLIYSAGLFDYIPSDRLTPLLKALYNSLDTNGWFIAPFKEANYYDTFDYHWYSRWDFFFQRSQEDFKELFKKAGIPENQITIERDDSGVILFFIIRKVN